MRSPQDAAIEWARLAPAHQYRRKLYAPHTSFHVFNRGKQQRSIFLDDDDRQRFLDAFASRIPADGSLAILAYALMGNHFHLVIHQYDTEAGMRTLMRGAIGSYVKGFNKRHGRQGALFTERFQAVRIDTHAQLKQAITYVHLNPNQPFSDRWTSHGLYVSPQEGTPNPCRRTDIGLRTFGGRAQYLERLFVERARRAKHAQASAPD